MNNSIAHRKLAWLGAAALVLGIPASTSVTYAQEPLVTVDIPFDFQQGSQLLKAGRYNISLENEHFMHLQGQGFQSSSLSRPEINTPTAKGKLVFRVYGNRYFLREVWQAYRDEHQVLPKSTAEKHVQTEEALAKRAGTEVALLEP